MQLQTLKLGGGGLLFAATTTARLDFQFAQPIAGAYAILKGTRFERPSERGSYYASKDADEEVSVLEVSAVTLFDALQSRTTGRVQIHFSLPGPTTPFSADLIHAEIDVLVVGV